MTTNPPLPQYDMMTGQLVTDASPALTNAAAMMANHADVVHVQLLDRMIVVPTAVVNGPLLRNKITSPDGQGPLGQHSEAYLLFVDWKNFHPLLEYMCGNPVQLPSGKSDLLQLKNTARKFEAREFERLVTRHLRRLHGGGCSPFACMHKPNQQTRAKSTPPAPAKLKPASQQQSLKQQQPLQQQPLQQQPLQQQPLRQHQHLQHPLQQQQTPPHAAAQLQKQQLAPTNSQEPMPVSNGTSIFNRMRAAKPHKANKAFETRQNQLYVAAHTRQPAEQIYDLQRPLIV